MFMSLTIDHPAVILSTAALYNTFQLTAIPRSALGDPMAGLPAPVFHLDKDTDSTKVTVTSTGLLMAKSATSEDGVVVIAELRTGDNVRRVDTAFVQVTTDPAPPVLTSFSIDPVPPDSAVWAMGFTGITPIFLYLAGIIPDFEFPLQLHPQVLDAANNPIAGLRVEYTSLDPTVAIVDRWTGRGHPFRPGHVRLVARTTAYGVSKADTTLFTTTWQFFQDVHLRATGVEPSEAWVAPHGVVFWFNDLQNAADLTFDDVTDVAAPPTAICDAIALFVGPGADCGMGNFPLAVPLEGSFGYSSAGIRQFPVPGVYTYRTSTGATGRIVVSSDTTKL
jgi:hypothetical protein